MLVRRARFELRVEHGDVRRWAHRRSTVVEILEDLLAGGKHIVRDDFLHVLLMMLLVCDLFCHSARGPQTVYGT